MADKCWRVLATVWTLCMVATMCRNVSNLPLLLWYIDMGFVAYVNYHLRLRRPVFSQGILWLVAWPSVLAAIVANRILRASEVK